MKVNRNSVDSVEQTQFVEDLVLFLNSLDFSIHEEIQKGMPKDFDKTGCEKMTGNLATDGMVGDYSGVGM